jgi:3-phosphoshikimate 1-carboxyvinyltransferase
VEAAFERSGPLRGELTVPGDKSISHRAAIVAALASGASSIRNFSPAADCASTIAVLHGLGVEARREGEVLVVEGCGDRGLEQPSGPLDAGNSGTTMRLLAGALAAMPLDVTMTGDSSLLERPMGRIIVPLSLMGASVSASDEKGHPPLRVRGGGLRGIEYAPPVASAQVKSAVLLAGLGASGRTSVDELVLTRDHTERILQLMGIDVRREGLAVTVKPGVPTAGDLQIPGDLSSAAFVIAAAVLCPGSEVSTRSVGLNPTRTGFLELLGAMGADIETKVEDDVWEPSGTIRARHGELRAIELSAEDVARSIDEVTLVALLATQARGRTEIRGAGELRHKESDRIKGTVESLKAMGARIEETADGMAVSGPCALRGTTVSARRDHRLAMMLALAGLIAEGRTIVRDWEWTGVSYPGFDEVLRELGAKVA